jgi:hypothetical protein
MIAKLSNRCSFELFVLAIDSYCPIPAMDNFSKSSDQFSSSYLNFFSVVQIRSKSNPGFDILLLKLSNYISSLAKGIDISG